MKKTLSPLVKSSMFVAAAAVVSLFGFNSAFGYGGGFIPPVVRPVITPAVEPVITPAPIQEVLGVQTYANGTLLRDNSTRRVYVVINGKLMHIASLAQLQRYAGKAFLNVDHSVIANSEMAVSVSYPDGTLIRVKGSARIYVMVNGQKKAVANLAELRKYAKSKTVFVSADVLALL